MPDEFVKLSQLRTAMQRVKSEFTPYELLRPLRDSSGNTILDSSEEEIQTRLFVITV